LNIERLSAEKSNINSQSIHVAEQSEQRQQKIRQLEAVSYLVDFSRSTLLSRPNKVGLKCPCILVFVRPQNGSSISMKFGM